MKLGFFTDPHYADIDDMGREPRRRHCRLALTRVREAMERFCREQVDGVVCLGDMLNGGSPDDRRDLETVTAVIREYPVPFFLAPGNHDADLFSPEEFEKIAGFPFCPPVADFGTQRLVVLNSNFTSEGAAYVPHRVDWRDCALPERELARLQQALDTAPGEVVVCLHATLTPCAWRHCEVTNSAAVRQLLERSGKVRHVYSGHFHHGQEETVNGITYHILPALSECGEAVVATF